MARMIDAMRQPLIALTQKAGLRATVKLARDAAGLFAKGMRAPAEKVEAMKRGLEEAAAFHAEETGAWLKPSHDTELRLAASEPLSQGFDAADLGLWLALAEKAGIETIPARPVLSLTEDEHARLTALPKEMIEGLLGAVVFHGDKNPERAVAMLDVALQATADPLRAGGETDVGKLVDRCCAAMDDVPEGWMVRFARCGSANLKSLSGCGLAGPEAPETAFGPMLSVGPGWIRRGNRRFVDVGDERIVKASAQGPVGPRVFYARPWVQPARFVEADDPHRAGSRFAGKGMWPIELRAFVQHGQVVGVSNYYPQIAMDVDPPNARLMLEARDQAQALADLASDLKLWPRFMDIEFARRMKPEVAVKMPAGFLEGIERDFGRENVAFTCDFLEVDDGAGGRKLVFLEAGPAASPVGGGHPCCFAGVSGPPTFGTPPGVHGVAFARLDHVDMMNPATWRAAEPHEMEGRILSWEEVEMIAGLDLDHKGPGPT